MNWPTTKLFSQFQSCRITSPQGQCHWRDIAYQLHISHKRQTIGFRVKSGQVTITVPYGLTERHLEEALSAKYNWLKRKLLQSHHLNSLSTGDTNPNQTDANQWLVWGVHKQVLWHTSKIDWYQLSATALQLSIRPRSCHPKGRLAALEKWYHCQSQAYVQQRVAYWSPIMGIDRSRINDLMVRKFYARWGSCNVHGVLKFNRLLAMAPPAVFDYVIIHELCHLQYMHHQSSFWQLVCTYCPDYKVHQQWLKSYGHRLLQRFPKPAKR